MSALLRYNSSGALDTSFGDGGLVVTDFDEDWDEARAMAIQGDGKIVVTGIARIDGDNQFALARYDSTGALDSGFGGGDGMAAIGLGQYGWDNGVAIDAQGNVFVGGFADFGAGCDFVLARFNPDGTLGAEARQYVWSPRYIDAPVLRDTFDAEGQLQAEDRLYYLGDANYNVTALVDPSGQVVERYVYSPYGMVTVCDAAFAPVAGNESAFANTVLYTGRVLDLETGLHYYRARYYDAMMGRFTGRDPIGYAAGDLNLYCFVGCGPIDHIDPSGTESGSLVLDPEYYRRNYPTGPAGTRDAARPLEYVPNAMTLTGKVRPLAAGAGGFFGRGPWTSEFEGRYRTKPSQFYDRSTGCKLCDRVGPIQIMFQLVDFGYRTDLLIPGYNLVGSIKTAWALRNQARWILDGAKSRIPYESHSVDPGLWASLNAGVSDTWYDEPGLDWQAGLPGIYMNSLSQYFEVHLVCLSGLEKGATYGGFLWGHAFAAAGDSANYTGRRWITPITAASSEFRQLVGPELGISAR